MTREQAIRAFREAASTTAVWIPGTCEDLIDGLAALGVLKLDSEDEAAESVIGELLVQRGVNLPSLGGNIVRRLRAQGFKITR